MQPIISKWYRTFRLIALVALLSVIVYIGIRIIISSTAQDKSKYKKMLLDWLIAMCLLFVLQFIMSAVMTVTQQITGMFNWDGKIIEGRQVDSTTGQIIQIGNDSFLSGIRGQINTASSFTIQFAYTMMYCILVAQTCAFTFQYLKRVLYLAFFTMIAPLICFTYPLDKIKDGQAQAFTIWIREYTFNALLPVMHIILYYVFVGSAMEFVKANPLYGVVAISFMVPAEKFFRKMFGFEKSSSTGLVSAAAGGALAMSAISKIGNINKNKSENTSQNIENNKNLGLSERKWEIPNNNQDKRVRTLEAGNNAQQYYKSGEQPEYVGGEKDTLNQNSYTNGGGLSSNYTANGQNSTYISNGQIVPNEQNYRPNPDGYVFRNGLFVPQSSELENARKTSLFEPNDNNIREKETTNRLQINDMAQRENFDNQTMEAPDGYELSTRVNMYIPSDLKEKAEGNRVLQSRNVSKNSNNSQNRIAQGQAQVDNSNQTTETPEGFETPSNMNTQIPSNLKKDISNNEVLQGNNVNQQYSEQVDDQYYRNNYVAGLEIYEPEESEEQQEPEKPKERYKRKLGKVRKGIKNVLENRKGSIGKGLQFVAEATAGTAFAIGGAAIGLASGDPSKAFQYGATGTGIGKSMAKGTVNTGKRVINGARGVSTDFKKGYYEGNDEYAKKQLVKELKKEKDFMKGINAVGIGSRKDEDGNAKSSKERDDEIKNYVGLFTANGITSKDDILNATKARTTFEKNRKVDRKKGQNMNYAVSDRELVAIARHEKGISDGYWGDPEKRTDFLNNLFYQTKSPELVEKTGAIISGIKGGEILKTGGSRPSTPPTPPTSTGGGRPGTPPTPPASTGGGRPGTPPTQPASTGGGRPGTPPTPPASTGGGRPGTPPTPPASTGESRPNTPPTQPASTEGTATPLTANVTNNNNASSNQNVSVSENNTSQYRGNTRNNTSQNYNFTNTSDSSIRPTDSNRTLGSDRPLDSDRTDNKDTINYATIQPGVNPNQRDSGMFILAGKEGDVVNTPQQYNVSKEFIRCCKDLGLVTMKDMDEYMKQMRDNGLDKKDIYKITEARLRYEKEHKVNRENNENMQHSITNDEAVKIALVEKGISKSSWNNETQRTKIISKMNKDFGDEVLTSKAVGIIDIMKKGKK